MSKTTSYQRLKNRIKELEYKHNGLYNELVEVVTNPNSVKAVNTKICITAMVNAERAMWYGSTKGDLNGIHPLIEKL